MPNQINNEPEAEITINELGLWIKNGFAEYGEKLLKLERMIEEKIDALEQKMIYRFDGVQNQIDNIYLNYTRRSEHELLCGRVRKIERKVGIPYQKW